MREISQAARALMRAPAFTAAAVLTFALGIGANTAIFSLVYGVLLRTLPYRDAGSLVLLQPERAFAGTHEPGNFSGVLLGEWQRRPRRVNAIAGYADAELAMETDHGVEPLDAECVSPNFFSTVDDRMALGRAIGAGDDRSSVAVISSGLWTRAFGHDPHVAGRSVVLSGAAYTIVGVTPAAFRFPDASVDVWIPMELARTNGVAPWLNVPRGGGMHLVGRLAPGSDVAEARTDVSRVAREIAADSGIGRNVTVTVTPLIDSIGASVRAALLILLASVALVLLIACVNLANLLLARQSWRAREIAVRLALGAPRLRLIRQSLVETALVAVAGGAAGLGIAAAVVRSIVWLEPARLPRLDAIRVDGPVMAFAAAATVAAALAAGAWPAIHASRENAAAALRASAGVGAPGGRRLRAALVVGELAVSIVLLVAAILLGRSFVRLLHTDVGARTDHTLAVLIDFSLGRRLPAEGQRERAAALVARVRAIPGVDVAALGTAVPPRGERARFTLRDLPTAHGVLKEVALDGVPVTSDFFRALGVPLLRGRLFDAGDVAGRPAVMIMSADTAALLFGDRPLGHTLSLPSPTGGHVVPTLVGVVGNVKYRGLDRAAPGTIYVPFAQEPWDSAYLLARTSGDPLAIVPGVRRAIGAIDRRIGILNVTTLDRIVDDQVAQPRFRTMTLTALAGLAIGLAGIGLYGVIAYSVSRRTAEIGLRMALGADGPAIRRMILKEGLTLGVLGACLGTAAAFAFARVLTSLLYGVTADDPASFLAAPIFLLLVTLAATDLPARRATAVDPIVALHAE